MHELKIASEMVGIIENVAEEEHLISVTVVNIQFGKMIQIVPDIFQFAFEEATRHTIAEGAKLNLEILPVKFACKKCNLNTEVSDLVFICPNCGSVDLDLIQGRETIIESIEGEK